MADQETQTRITFVAAGETPQHQARNLEMVKPSPGYPTSVQLLADAIARRAELVVLDFTPQVVTIRFQIDQVWHTMPPMDRGTGDYMLATLKQLAGLNFRDRKSRQEGTFRSDTIQMRHDTKLITQGIRTGERAAIYITPKKKAPLDTLEQMGMRESMVKQLEKFLAKTDASMLMATAMPGDGYSTFWRGVLGAADRFTRDYYILEDGATDEQEVINITRIPFNPEKGETAFTPIPQLMLKEPNVLVFPEITDGGMLNQVCDLSQKEDMPMIIRNMGKNCADGLLRLLSLEPNMSTLLETLNAVVCGRLIRKLCENCRIPFRPNPVFLQKLGIPAGRVHLLYKAFEYQPGMLDEQGEEIPVCHECNGIGYKGITGLFELLNLNDEVQAAILASPRLDTFTKTLQQMHHVSIRDEGVVLIAKGITSVEELQRVLKK